MGGNQRRNYIRGNSSKKICFPPKIHKFFFISKKASFFFWSQGCFLGSSENHRTFLQEVENSSVRPKFVAMVKQPDGRMSLCLFFFGLGGGFKRFFSAKDFPPLPHSGCFCLFFLFFTCQDQIHPRNFQIDTPTWPCLEGDTFSKRPIIFQGVLRNSHHKIQDPKIWPASIFSTHPFAPYTPVN